MYDPDNGTARGLHPETVKRIREVFEGNRCCECDAASERLLGGRFYCIAHYPKNRRRALEPQVYHCSIAVESL